MWILFCALLIYGAPAAPCDVGEYYAGLDLNLSGAALETELHARVASPHTVIPYTSDSSTDCWDALRVLDADPSNPDNVVLIYARTSVAGSLANDASLGWNREHVWPKSYGVFTSGPDTSDLHCLRASDFNVNSARGNLYFDTCTTGCSSPAHSEAAADTAKNSVAFMPPAAVRGDIARCMFYMTVRYDGTESSTEHLQLTDCPSSSSSAMGKLSTLLQWHLDDPVDAVEVNRNGRLCTDYQGNRNPFVDHPTLVSQLFTGADPFCSGGGPTPAPSGDDGTSDSPGVSPTPGPTPPPPSGCVLTTGDVMVIGYNADGTDSLTLLLLTSLPAGAQFRVTDNGWQAAGAWRDTEGVVQYAVPAGGHEAGSILSFQKGSYGVQWSQLSGTVDFSTGGDQVFVYEECPGGTNFVFGLNVDGPAWAADASSSQTSAAPAQLGAFALALPEFDNYAYTGATTGTKSGIQAAILDPANWNGDDGSHQTPPSSFSLTQTPTLTTADANLTTAESNSSTLTTTTTSSISATLTSSATTSADSLTSATLTTLTTTSSISATLTSTSATTSADSLTSTTSTRTASKPEESSTTSTTSRSSTTSPTSTPGDDSSTTSTVSLVTSPTAPTTVTTLVLVSTSTTATQTGDAGSTATTPESVQPTLPSTSTSPPQSPPGLTWRVPDPSTSFMIDFDSYFVSKSKPVRESPALVLWTLAAGLILTLRW